MKYTLGSLFDGSGGFPLAGSLCGITPKWAAEIEPYPIAVTRSRFPAMKHLGDISKVSGYEIEPVDIITFGSPCQDLSIAGKRAGLKHEANGDEETTRSGLFMEAVRIIKEMREATNGLYPRFALWENVPGAFSSNKGEDFRIVLEELIKIVEPEAVMPAVPAKGWAYADSYIGDGWSLAYRVFDSQYWGVPQRRRRIHLILDFGGGCAREILFEREGLRGYFAEGGTPRKAAAGDAADRPGADDCEGKRVKCYDARGNGDGKTVSTLTGDHDNRITDYTSVVCEPIPIHDKATRYKGGGQTRNGDGAGNGFCVGKSGDPRPTLSTCDHHMVCYIASGKDTTGTLMASMAEKQCLEDQEAFSGDYHVIEERPIVFDKEVYNSGVNATGAHYIAEGGPSPTLRTSAPPGVCIQYIVRRLTPTECARLQGFPDAWGHPDHKEDFTDEEYRFWLNVRNTHAAINGKAVKEYTKPQMLTWYNKLHTDSAEYKMWGNGIALPPALYCMQGMVEAMDVKTK